MSRTARAVRAGICYHVFTRGNSRQTVFHDASDFQLLTGLLRLACTRRPIGLLGWCLMPNHFHLVLRPENDGDLGRWMHWLMTSHVRYHQRRYATIGRIWQGRYKAFPIQEDVHFLSVLRYVERNPVRARLVEDASHWPWSSASARQHETGGPLVVGGTLSPSPVDLPVPWFAWVNEPLTDAELAAIRTCARRERPYGDTAWVTGTADRLGLRSSLRPRGRPAGVLR